MLFKTMRECCIRIPLEILLILDQKISKIEPEMAELAIFLFVQKSDSSKFVGGLGGGKLISSLYRTKMAPRDQLSTMDRNMASFEEWNVVRIDA